MDRKALILSIALWALAGPALLAPDSRAAGKPEWPGRKSSWHGFARYDFELDGRACIAVLPAEAHPARPWIWRARFFGHEPQADLALLARGFHLVYMDVAGLYGAPAALAHWDAFYRFLTTRQGLARRAALEGMSRGGLIVYNWAAANPRKVACIYADAPVCDIRSWPGGRGASRGHRPSWEACLKAYGLDEQGAATFRGNPLDHLAPLARAGVPLLSICGLADQVVPYEENTARLAAAYKLLGGPITVITKPGVGHHPHSLKDPAPIVAFVLRHTVALDPYLELRGGLRNSLLHFARQGTGRVVFLGGSITHNPGWRDMVCKDLRERFPRTAFTFRNAGIPSMGSTPGAFRLERDVLRHGPPDLLFVEAAVNDSCNLRSKQEILRGMEGIVRHVRRACPETDIALLHFADPAKTAEYDAGHTPEVIALHEQVAAHYQVPSLELAREVAERMRRGEFSWKEDFRNLHPAPFGQRLYFRSIQRLLDRAWQPAPRAGEQPRPHPLPAPLDPLCYDGGRLLPASSARNLHGWHLEQDWRPDDGAGTRSGFARVPMWIATQPGATCELDFNGPAIGIFVAAGPDAGILVYRVDHRPPGRVDLFTPWSAHLHLPWLHILEAELAPGPHRLELRLAAEHNPAARGCAARIALFAVRGGAH